MEHSRDQAHNTDKIALVTGAGSGIGKAIALELADAGFSLALVGRRKEPLQEVADLTEHNGSPKARVFVYDMENVDGVSELVTSIADEMKGLTVVVNNAGTFAEKPFTETTREDFLQSFNVNLLSVVETVRAALPFLDDGVQRGSHGAVIFIGSKAAERGYRNGTIYSATKSALRAFADSLFYDLQEQGIRVSLVEPGVVNTTMHAGDLRYVPENMIQPEDIAKTVRFMLELPDTACPFLVSVRPQHDPRRLPGLRAGDKKLSPST